MNGVMDDVLFDIEDLMEGKILPKKESVIIRPAVKVHMKRKVNEDISPPVIYNGIPGTQTIYLRTWGCAHNNSDSEYMAGLLKEYGYKLTDNPEDADLWVLNSCTVKGPAETHFVNEIEKGKKMRKHIVVAGCVPQGAPKSPYLKGLSVIGVHNIDRVVEVVEETLKGHTVRLYSIKREGGKKLGGAPLQLPKVRRNKYIEIIPISTGCLNQCTYCKTKHARGELGSYPLQDIVNRAEQAFSEGVVEVWITSEDTGAYGRDIGTSLPDLLWAILDVTPANCKVRVGMTNPPYILDHLKEMAEVLTHPKVYSFLHVPVQSGSDAVLAEMRREYTVDDFKYVVNYLKARVPGLTVATDIICGFPTETEEDFQETVALCKEYKFPTLFINQFYPRPGTVAAKMKRIPTQEVKKRTKALSEWFQTYQPYTHKLGEVQQILVTEKASDNINYVGHNDFYEQVLIPSDPAYMGKVVKVKITDTKKHCMIGDPVCVVDAVPNEGEKMTQMAQNPGPTDSMPYFTLFLFLSVLSSLIFYFYRLKEIYRKLMQMFG